jgi:hypothetical protein
MALIVGTDSYVTLAEANTYWSARNNSTWSAASDANKEKAIREATQYLDGAYSFIGFMTSFTQPLAFPRNGVVIEKGNFAGRSVESSAIPDQVKMATFELALEALGERLEPTNNDSISKVKVDVIEVDYADFAPSKKTFSFVTKILDGLILSSSNGAFAAVGLERA